jgi:argininosuccinate synthase
MTTPVVLAYAGNGDIADAVRRLTAAGLDVATLTLDFGQKRDVEEMHARALGAGAARAHVLDVREEFVRDFLLPALHAAVPHPGSNVVSAALGHALLARKLVDVAAIEGARTVAHFECSDAKRRLEANLHALDETITMSSMACVTMDGPDSAAAAIWGHPETTSLPFRALDTPASLDLSFERGMPVAINGVQMPIVELIESLSIIGEKHGIGRVVEQRNDAWVEKPRVTPRGDEAPAAAILDEALRALEAASVSPELMRMRRDQAATYAGLVFDGRWFTQARSRLDGFNAKVQQMVTGTVRLRLFDGKLLSSSVLEGDATVSRS